MDQWQALNLGHSEYNQKRKKLGKLFICPAYSQYTKRETTGYVTHDKANCDPFGQ